MDRRQHYTLKHIDLKTASISEEAIKKSLLSINNNKAVIDENSLKVLKEGAEILGLVSINISNLSIKF